MKVTKSEREEISRFLSQGISMCQIAKNLGRNKSTISREVRRKGMIRTTYRAFSANVDARRNRSKSGRKFKLETNVKLRKVVLEWLGLKWSPEQIMERLEIEYPKDKDMRIAHETIYRYLYVHPREILRKELIRNLRRKRATRKKRKKEGHVEKRGKIPNMTSIEERPLEIERRQIPGYWEGDLILGKERKTAMGTLSERSTRFTVLAKIERDCYNAKGVRKAFAKAFKSIPDDLKKSLTYDQGREMKGHELFTEETRIKVYFAHVGSPWERGTNENTNSLVRQYFPKSTDLSKVTTEELRKVQDELNDRPRKCLGFQKPIEVFGRLLQ